MVSRDSSKRTAVCVGKTAQLAHMWLPCARSPRAGSETAPFKWKDYAPRVFHRLRQSFGMDNT